MDPDEVADLVELWNTCGGANSSWALGYHGPSSSTPGAKGWPVGDPCGVNHKTDIQSSAWSGISCSDPDDSGEGYQHLLRFWIVSLSCAQLPDNLLSHATQLAELRVDGGCSSGGSGFCIAGTLPDGLGSTWPNFQRLSLEYHHLRGTLPPGFGSNWGLSFEGLDLYHSGLGGTFPDGFGSTWTNLDELQINYNNFTGTLPRDFGANWTKLTILELGHNRFTGTVPATLGSSATLGTLSLDHNRFTAWEATDMLLARNPEHPTWSSSATPRLPRITSIDLSFNDLRNVGDVSSNGYYSNSAWPLNLLRLSDNPRLALPLWQLLDAAAHVQTIDLSNTAVHGEWESSEVEASVLLLRNTAISGSLPDSDRQLVSEGDIDNLAYMDVRGTRLRSPTHKYVNGHRVAVGPELPFYLTVGVKQDAAAQETAASAHAGANANSSGRAYCHAATPAPVSISWWLAPRHVDLDLSYDNYTRCGCKAGFEGLYRGDSFANCTACPRGTWSADAEPRGSRNTCAPCDAGFYQPTDDRAGTISCVPCSGGEWSSAAWPLPRCRACPPGRYSSPGVGNVDGVAVANCTPCSPGHFAARSSAAACDRCAAGRYAQAGSVSCFPCEPAAAMTCTGGALHLNDGWWADGAMRLPDTRMHRCLTRAACTPLVNTSSGVVRVECAAGSGGPLCAVCGREYLRTAPGVCTRCPSFGVSIAVMSVSVVAATVFVCVSVFRKTARARAGGAETQTGRTVEFSSHAAVESEAPSFAPRRSGRGVLRVLVSYLQLSALASEFSAHGSAAFREVMAYPERAAGDSVASIVSLGMCVADWGFAARLVAAALLPPVAMLVLALVLTAMRWVGARRKRRVVRAFFDDFVPGAAVILFLVYSRVTRLAVDALRLHGEPIGGVFYLQSDFRVRSDQAGYIGIAALGVVMLLVYTLAAPACAFAWLWWETSHGTADGAAARRLGFLTRGYRTWWWEATVVSRKVVFAVLAFVEDTYTQTVVAIVVLLCLLVVHVQSQPYSAQYLNNAETLALFTLTVTQLACLWLAHVDAMAIEDARTSEASGLWVTGVLLALNVGTTSRLAFLYVREAPWRSCAKCALVYQYKARPRPRMHREGGSVAAGVGGHGGSGGDGLSETLLTDSDADVDSMELVGRRDRLKNPHDFAGDDGAGTQ